MKSKSLCLWQCSIFSLLYVIAVYSHPRFTEPLLGVAFTSVLLHNVVTMYISNY